MTGIRLFIQKWAILHCNKLWTQWLRAVITEAYSIVATRRVPAVLRSHSICNAETPVAVPVLKLQILNR
jgi:hypothetical protein